MEVEMRKINAGEVKIGMPVATSPYMEARNKKGQCSSLT